MPRKWLFLLIAVSVVVAVLVAMLRRPALERQANRMQREVTAIRGLEFTQSIVVRRLSAVEGRAFVEGEIAKMPKIEDYWAVVRMVGLYRGPDLEPPEKIYAQLADLVLGAYDEDTDTLFLFDDMDEREERMLFVHELYHALQDQHFDLKGYLIDRARLETANADEILARSAVVEGDASYAVANYLGRKSYGAQPTRGQLTDIIVALADWTPEKWDESLQDPALTKKMRAHLLRAIEARNRVPRYMVGTFMGTYTEGMIFIHAVHEKGWSEVDKLYRDYPPESSEQILHPEKWFAREAPVTIAWPSFESDPLFADWQLLVENVLGERMWREVFWEYGLESEAKAVAAGWGGDRYAVFKHRNDNIHLMLTHTSWDTPQDAAEFSAAYRKVLETKARGTQARVFTQGNDVLIVECPLDAPADALMEFNRRAVPTGR